MEKEKAKLKLKELGIDSLNYAKKRTYIKNKEVHVGIFPAELKGDLYFSVNDQNILYRILPEVALAYETEAFMGQQKHQVPLSACTLVWEDKVYQEMPDIPFSQMTVRTLYAVLHNKPVSNEEWLNTLIRENQ